MVNKFSLIIGSALVNVSFLQIDNPAASLQNQLFSISHDMFPAPGSLAQLQPHFIRKRSVLEACENLLRMYEWFLFIVGKVVTALDPGIGRCPLRTVVLVSRCFIVQAAFVR